MQRILVGDQYIIEETCYETYPCQHNVRNLQDGTRAMMSGKDIYNILQHNGLSNAHFSQYSNDGMVQQQRTWQKQQK